jgi:hypothetical protein
MSSQRVASSRSFGLVMSGLFFAVGILHLVRGGTSYPWLIAGGVLLVISLLIPRVLAPLKRLWLKFGVLLAAVVSPVVLALVYVFSIVLIGGIIRLFKKDLLSLRQDPSRASYWIERDPAGPPPQSLKRQF